MTATADAPTRAEIAARLFVRPPQVFVRSFDRPNLFLAMRPKSNATRQLIERLERASRRKRHRLLRFAPAHRGAGRGIRRARPARAALSRRPRPFRARAPIRTPSCARTVASSAPPSPSAWASTSPTSASSFTPTCRPRSKPITRRSAAPAATDCRRTRFTLYGAGDIELRRRQILESGAPDERKRVEMAKLDDLVALCETARCRRQTLARHVRREVRPLRPLRRLQGRRPPDRRAGRGAKGAVGRSAHLGAVLLRPSRQHSRRQDDRGGRAARA